MTHILELIQNNIGLGVLGLLTAAAASMGPKLVRGLVAKEVAKLLAKALNPDISDPVAKERVADLLRAAARLAAYELPNRGAHGDDRKNLLAARLSHLMPEKQSAVIAALLDEALDTLDDGLEAVPPAPAAPSEPAAPQTPPDEPPSGSVRAA